MVVIGIVALLIGLLLPALARARSASRSAACASQMRVLGEAMHGYAQAYDGWVPRDHTAWRPDRNPYWMLLLSPYVAGDGAHGPPTVAHAVFHCPAHPLDGEIPGTYLINAFKFECEPHWDPDGPIRLARVGGGSNVVWLAEAASSFAEPANDDGTNRVYDAVAHDVWSPLHLPGGAEQRVSDDMHHDGANLLFFDSSVRRAERGAIALPMFDDGMRQRATARVYFPVP